ncbi:hypothetical protein DYB31_007763 [Aphanomyces astaci]|uniref:RPAP1 N-terminal domain-containing protein n=1 Tax=Aphanomyces astaci TaxID=112090 RepID=A0A397E9G2_APHAT|nr:hypothetical protein DYB31_007763 [Aphanomyces astaci]
MDAELAKLLHEQEQFMQSGKASSAKLHTAKPKVSPSPSQAAPLPPTIMRAQVMERSTPVKTMPMSTLPPTDGGFPSAKKTSLFGRRRNQQAARSESSSPVPSTARREPSSKSSSSPIPNDIQDDNNAAIANMSVEEIRQAQAELHASLPPEILDMFKKRRNFPAAAPPAVACSSSRPDLPPPSFQTLPTQNIPMPAPQTDESLRRAVSELPKEERLKHEWMQSLPPSHQQNQDPVSEKLAQEHEQRRVDLQGHAINATADTVPLHSDAATSDDADSATPPPPKRPKTSTTDHDAFIPSPQSVVLQVRRHVHMYIYTYVYIFCRSIYIYVDTVHMG